MPTAQQKTQSKGNGDGERFEAKLWRMADALRGQHGRRRIQARRPRPDLPQVHL